MEPLFLLPYPTNSDFVAGVNFDGILDGTAAPTGTDGERLILADAYKLSSLIVTVEPGLNTRGDATVVTVLVNGAPTALTLSIPAATAGTFQVNAQVPVAAFAEVTINVTTGPLAGVLFGPRASIEVATP